MGGNGKNGPQQAVLHLLTGRLVGQHLAVLDVPQLPGFKFFFQGCGNLGVADVGITQVFNHGIPGMVAGTQAGTVLHPHDAELHPQGLLGQFLQGNGVESIAVEGIQHQVRGNEHRVDGKTGKILHRDRHFPVPAGEFHQGFIGLVAGLPLANNFHQAVNICREKVVQPGGSFGVVNLFHQLFNQKRRGVADQDRLRRTGGRQLGKHLDFEIHFFDCRLDHQVADRQILVAAGTGNLRRQLVHLLLGHFSFGNPPAQGLDDPLFIHGLDQVVIKLLEHHPVAGHGRVQTDQSPHHSKSNHTNSLHFFHCFLL